MAILPPSDEQDQFKELKFAISRTERELKNRISNKRFDMQRHKGKSEEKVIENINKLKNDLKELKAFGRQFKKIYAFKSNIKRLSYALNMLHNILKISNNKLSKIQVNDPDINETKNDIRKRIIKLESIYNAVFDGPFFKPTDECFDTITKI